MLFLLIATPFTVSFAAGKPLLAPKATGFYATRIRARWFPRRLHPSEGVAALHRSPRAVFEPRTLESCTAPSPTKQCINAHGLTTQSQCSAPLWPSRWPPACRPSRRRGSWQRRPLSHQCCHSARLSPRRPSSNDPAWYRHFELTRAPRVATRSHESPRVSRESSFATVPHAGSRRRRTASWRSSSIPCIATRTSS